MEGAAGNANRTLPPGLTEEEAEELRIELTKVCDHDIVMDIFRCALLNHRQGLQSKHTERDYAWYTVYNKENSVVIVVINSKLNG